MPRSRLGLRRGLSALAPSPGSSWSIAMGTLEGFPNPPAKLRCQQSWQAPHALPMGTLGGFPNPPAKLRCQQSWQAAHAALSWELWKGFPNPPAKLRCQQSWQAAHAALSWELWKGFPNPTAKLRCQQSWQAAHAALSWELWKGFPNPPAKLRCQQSWQAAHAALSWELWKGFPNPPAKLRCQQSWQAAHAALSWELWKGFPNPPAKLRCQQSWQAAHAALSWELWKGFPNPPAKLRCQQSWQAAHAALSWELWKGFPNPPAKLRCQQSTATMRHRCRLRQQPFEQRLLRVQAVLRLLPHDAGRPFDNFVSDFLAPVRRQTVQHHGFGVGFAHEFLVEAIADESAPASLHFGFLAHRGEHVGGKHVAASDRFARIVRDGNTCLAGGFCAGKELGVRLVALGAGQCQVQTQKSRRLDPGVGHVVAVANPGVALAAQNAEYVGRGRASACLAIRNISVDGLQIGQHLAGM